MQDAMHSLTYGLFVVTACLYGRDNGCIVNTVGQVTSSPNRISITVNKSNYTHDMIIKTGAFNLSFLSEDSEFDIYQRFGFQSGRDTDKLQGAKYQRAANGIIYLTEQVNAYLSGKVVQTVDLGSHTLFIADITGGEVLSKTPSVSYAYYFANIKPKPEKPKKTGWICTICGYVYEGDELPPDYICPICKHPASDFKKL